MLLLHISDIHFRHPHCHGDADPELFYRDELIHHSASQARALGDVSAILVSGDIAFCGIKEEYDAARLWLENLAGAIGCPVARIYVVPGNHDVDRCIFDKIGTSRNAVSAVYMQHSEQNRERELNRQLSMTDTADAFFKSIAAYNIFAAQYDCQVNGDRVRWSTELRIDRRTVLKLYGLNTTLLSGIRGDDMQGELFMGACQLNVPRSEGTVNLILAHHPPDWMSDQDTIEARLLGGPNLVLFGHKHRQNLHRDVGGYIMFSAGSVNPERYEGGWCPAYNFIRITPQAVDERRNIEISVSQFMWQNQPNGFIPKMDMSTGEEVFRHTITIEGENSEEMVVQGTVRNQGGDDMTGSINEEHDRPSFAGPNIRNLIFRFWELTKQDRRKIMKVMGVVAVGENITDEPFYYRTAFIEISRENRLAELENTIAEKE